MSIVADIPSGASDVLDYGTPATSLPSLARSAVLGGVGGGALGIVLSFLGLVAYAYETADGCALVLAVAASPFSLARDAIIALVASPVLWTIVGTLVGGSVAGRSSWRRAAKVALAAHYIALPIAAISIDWSYLLRAPAVVIWATCIGMVVYYLGQVCAWRTLGRSRLARRSRP